MLAGKVVMWRHRVTGELIEVVVENVIARDATFTPERPANGPQYFGNVIRGKGHWQFNERYEWIQILTRR